MDTSTLVQAFMGIIIMLLGWWNNSLQNRMKRTDDVIDALRENIFAHRENSATHYATKADIQGVNNRLDTITNLILPLTGQHRTG
jgi:hypothetical protein